MFAIHSKRPPSNDMPFYQSRSDTISSIPNFMKHLRKIQFLSAMPLSLNSTSFATVSYKYLFISGVFSVLSVLHHWHPALSLQWSDTGPISSVLTIVQKLLYTVLPFVFVINTIRNRFKFERSTKQLLSVLKTLGLWKHQMYVSCKVFMVFYGIGIVLFVARNVATAWLGKSGIIIVCDDFLWILHDTYLAAWALQFVYTVRSIEACYNRLSRTTTRKDLSPFFQIYNKLIDIAAETNDFYDIPMSLVLLTFLLSFIDYTNITWEETITSVDRVYMYMWMTVFAALLVSILGSCNSASEQAQDCNEALLKHLIHNKISVNHDNPLLPLHLCANRSLVFKAFKSFTINYNLGISMVAAYVTYMILLIQVDHSSQKQQLSFAALIPANSTHRNTSQN